MGWLQRAHSVDSPFRTCSTVIVFSSVGGLEVNLLVRLPTEGRALVQWIQSAVGGVVGGEGEEEEEG